MEPLELTITGIAKGGAGVAREPSGRVVFVDGALAGERVSVLIGSQRKSFATAQLMEVLDASPARREPPCPHVARGCGGCDLQHADPAHQLAVKVSVVADALTRIGRFADLPEIRPVPLPTERYRTTVRVGVSDGEPAYRRRHEHDLVSIDSCLVLHPVLEELLTASDFGGAREVTLRAGVRTGERLAFVVGGTAAFPSDVTVVNGRAGRGVYHETVSGRTWQISARSFFQIRPDGAEALVEEVGTAIEGTSGTLIDLYGGVGLFAGTVGSGYETVLVEQSKSATGDAEVNLAGTGTAIFRSDVDRWGPVPADVVVADPSRAGLGKTGVAAVVATGAPRIALVSCDPAAGARDAQLLHTQGYELVDIALVDLFGNTSHIETVSRFDLR